MKKLPLSMALLALVTAGCGDDTVEPDPCNLIVRDAPADTLAVPGTGTVVAFYEVTLINAASSTFTGEVEATLEQNAANPPEILLQPTDLSILPGDSLVITVTVIAEPTTTPGDHAWRLEFGDDCDETEIRLVVEDTEASALGRFIQAWEGKDVMAYADLLAEDFRFYVNPTARSIWGLPEFVNRTDDSTAVERLFSSEEITYIGLSLTSHPAIPASEPGRENWSRIDVTDERLQIDKNPPPGHEEGVTLLVVGQPQKFYFRRGRTPGDAMSASGSFYITEWRDLGNLDGVFSAISSESSWSSIKFMYR